MLAVPAVGTQVYEPVAAPVAAPRAYSGLLGEIAALIANGEAWATDPVPRRETAPATRVQLGFRDGTTASLDPGSDEASALEELARILTGRDALGT